MVKTVRHSLPTTVTAIAPGFALCVALALAAKGIGVVEFAALHRAPVEDIVIAIVLGIALRSRWRPPEPFGPGIRFSATNLLEAAIVVLGLSIGPDALAIASPKLVAAMLATVVLGCLASYAVGRCFGLSRNLSILIACGNSICGNTAIVVIAPVVGASDDEVGASVTFTAIVGIAVVLLLPQLSALLHYNQIQAGALAGLTVYSVTQVVAATVATGPLSVQVGTLVKLARMLTLGPVAMTLSMFRRRADGGRAATFKVGTLVPWFMLGFLAMVCIRASGVVPPPVSRDLGRLADVMVTVTMAALGLGVDVAWLASTGTRAACVVCISLSILAGLSVLTLHVLRF